jgi:DNA-binding NtrC family response regulator
MQSSLLIVEDDLDQLAMLKRWFIRAGYQVTGVSHPRQALEAASFRPFQVAVINQTLPEIDGFELVRRFRGLLGNLQVVMQSYDIRPTSDPSAAEVFAYVSKPCQKSLLEATVRNAFERTELELPAMIDAH